MTTNPLTIRRLGRVNARPLHLRRPLLTWGMDAANIARFLWECRNPLGILAALVLLLMYATYVNHMAGALAGR